MGILYAFLQSNILLKKIIIKAVYSNEEKGILLFTFILLQVNLILAHTSYLVRYLCPAFLSHMNPAYNITLPLPILSTKTPPVLGWG